MTMKSSCSYATILESRGLYSYVPSFIILRLMFTYDGLFEILHNDLKINRLMYVCCFFCVGNSAKEELE